MDKKEIRKNILGKLDNISIEDRLIFEAKLYNKLFNNNIFKKSDTVALTISFGSEINTYPIIEKLLSEGKTVCSPICNPKDKSMIFYKFFNIEDLVDGYYGIKEPPKEKIYIVDKSNIDLILVPGVAFDREKYRIGFGGGYYDRYLSDYEGYTIALAFKVQLIDKFKRNKYDIALDEIIIS